MNLIGETLVILTSRDPTKTGRSGKVLLETAQTFIIDAGSSSIMVEKAGAAFRVARTGAVVTGEDLSGRLQDRLGRRRP